METETKEQREARLALEVTMRGIAQRLRDAMPPGVGFLFAMFDFGAKGNMAYTSTGDREGCIKMLDELRARLVRQ